MPPGGPGRRNATSGLGREGRIIDGQPWWDKHKQTRWVAGRCSQYEGCLYVICMMFVIVVLFGKDAVQRRVETRAS